MNRPIPTSAREVVEQLIETKRNDIEQLRVSMAKNAERHQAMSNELFRAQNEISELCAWLGEPKPGDGYPYG